MHFKLGQLLFIAVVSTALSAQYDTYCSKNYAPICGSDGITYNNTCHLKGTVSRGKKVTLANYGPCKEAMPPPTDYCQCQFNFEPVCGTDGRTYGNKCLLQCTQAKYDSSLKIAYNNTCKIFKDDCSAQCPIKNRPVCGKTTRGTRITYNNVCLFQCAAKSDPSLILENKSPCPKNPEKPWVLKKRT